MTENPKPPAPRPDDPLWRWLSRIEPALVSEVDVLIVAGKHEQAVEYLVKGLKGSILRMRTVDERLGTQLVLRGLPPVVADSVVLRLSIEQRRARRKDGWDWIGLGLRGHFLSFGLCLCPLFAVAQKQNKDRGLGIMLNALLHPTD